MRDTWLAQHSTDTETIINDMCHHLELLLFTVFKLMYVVSVKTKNDGVDNISGNIWNQIWESGNYMELYNVININDIHPSIISLLMPTPSSDSNANVEQDLVNFGMSDISDQD